MRSSISIGTQLFADNIRSWCVGVLAVLLYLFSFLFFFFFVIFSGNGRLCLVGTIGPALYMGPRLRSTVQYVNTKYLGRCIERYSTTKRTRSTKYIFYSYPQDVTSRLCVVGHNHILQSRRHICDRSRRRRQINYITVGYI